MAFTLPFKLPSFGNKSGAAQPALSTVLDLSPAGPQTRGSIEQG